MERIKRMTHAAVDGPRGKLVTRVEKPLAKRTPLSRDAIRSLAGAVFLFLAVKRVFRAVRAGLR